MDTFENNNEFENQPAESNNSEPKSDYQENSAFQPVQEKPQDQHTQSSYQYGSPTYSKTPYSTTWPPQQPNGAYYGQQQTPPKQQKLKKSHKGAWKTVLAASLTVAVIAGSCGGTAAFVNNRWEKKTGQMTADFDDKISSLQAQLNGQSVPGAGPALPVVSPEGILTPGQVYQKCVNSVVAISNEATRTNIYGQVSKTASSGSGFIISDDGYVISNYHVAEGASKLTVITYDSTEYEAKLIGFDKGNDVALLKIDATGLTPVSIGNSDALQVGEQVAAIGNPLGELTSSMSVGYVSAKDRTINTDGTYINMIQIDAAINPGNSGGPLFNMKGEVVGITTAKYSGATSSGATIEGIGFAIPIDDVMSIISDLREYGYVTGAYLGVVVRSVDEGIVKTYGLPMGSLVLSVTDGSCADKAGVQQQDIIIGLGDHEVKSNPDLTRALRKFEAGDETTITVYRSGQKLELPIVLDEKPVVEEDAPEQQPSGEIPSNGNYEDWYNYFAPFFGGR